METIHIYHSNDIHSHFEHWPRIHSLFEERKRWHKDAGDEVFLFDIGDHMDRWHPYTEATMGKGNTDLLNNAGYTAVTIGNNEGITLPHEELDTLYEHAKFDVLAANLYQADGNRPNWAKPFTIYKTRKGTRIGVIGLTVNFGLFYELLGWSLTDPLTELKKVMELLKGQTDVIILLSHLGINEDERIAEEFPKIDVILGGHTHHILHEGRLVNETLLGAAGKHGQYVGHIMLDVCQSKTVTDKKAMLYDVNELPESEHERNDANSLIEIGKQLLDEKVVTLSKAIQSDYFKESELPNMLCEALREWCNADCAFLNAGLLLGSLSGEVTKFDLHKVCPHLINPCSVELTGSELKEVLLQARDEKWPHMPILGLGFRGQVMGKMIYNQISFTENEHKVMINGVNLLPEKVYRLAIPDMFTFGKFFPEILRAKRKQYFLPELMRDLLQWKLMK